MRRTNLAALGLVAAAAPVHAHEAGGLVHLHPHGSEALIVGAAIAVAAFVLWRVLRGNG